MTLRQAGMCGGFSTNLCHPITIENAVEHAVSKLADIMTTK